jgi:predicted RNA-binding protein with PUA-like domain
MNYWLVKSEPSVYSFDQLLRDKSTIWDGVRNFAARNHLKSMKKGDLVLFYHSNEGKDVVGIAKVLKEFYPDPTADDGDWVVVELGPYKKLKKLVTLEQVKKDKRLKDMALLRIARLSVQPVKKEEFDVILELAGE